MKKILTVVFCLYSAFCFSQRAEVFVLGGLNGSILKIDGNINSDYTRLYSPTFGVMGGIGSQYVLAETGLLWSRQGMKIRSNKSELRVDYFDIPLMAVVAPENFRFYAGPQISFLNSAETRGTDITPSFEKINWAVRFGAGYERRRVLLQLHFVNGVTDIYKGEEEFKTRGFQISLGYMLFSNYTLDTGKEKKEDDLIPSHRVID
jgi:hypothetical protein